MKLFAFAFLSLMAGAFAAASPSCGDRPIRLAFFEYGLYYFHGQGIDKDLADALQQRSGCRFELQEQARARTWHDLRSGQLDMALSALQSPDRDSFAWFEPYLWLKNLTLLPRDVAQSVTDAGTFLARPQLKMGVVRGFKHGETQDRWIDRLRRQNRVVEFVDAEQLFRNLAAHHVDAAIADILVFQRLLTPVELENVVVEDWIPAAKGDPVNVVIAKARFSAEEAEQWRVLVRQMLVDGTIRAILRRYLPEDDAAKLTKP